MDEMKCVKCQGPASGWKCDVCGEESEEHNKDHGHGADHCMKKCVKCSEAEVKCTC